VMTSTPAATSARTYPSCSAQNESKSGSGPASARSPSTTLGDGGRTSAREKRIGLITPTVLSRTHTTDLRDVHACRGPFQPRPIAFLDPDGTNPSTGGNTMTTRTRLVRILAVVFAFGLVAAACGDDDEGGDVSGNDLGGRTVTVGVENAYLPFNYVPAGETEGQGWDYDAWREICRIINCEADFVVAGWPDVIDQVAQGELDTAADGISITDERKEIVAYSQAYMTVDQKFIVAKDDDRYGSADDIINGDAIVGTQVGTTNFELANELLGGDARISAFDQFGLAVQALINGDVDAVIIDDAAGQGYVGENADAVELIDDALQADPLGFIFPKDSEIIPAVDYAIDQMRDSGFLDELGQKYFTDAFTVTYDDIEG